MDISPYLEKLEDIENRVCEEGRSGLLARERAAVVSRVLHGEFGFVGDSQTYDEPVNADFIQLLDRKLGLPIALSILYVAMARRAGWSAYVLNLAGHVLVQIGEKSPVAIELFAGGGLVSQQKIAAICQAYLGQERGAPAFSVVRLGNRGVLAWLLNNQAILQLGFNDVAAARESLFAMSEVAPDMRSLGYTVEIFSSATEFLAPPAPRRNSASASLCRWPR